MFYNFIRDILKVMNNGEGLFELSDPAVEDSGLPIIFTTNVLGHHLLVSFVFYKFFCYFINHKMFSFLTCINQDELI